MRKVDVVVEGTVDDDGRREAQPGVVVWKARSATN